MPVSFWLLVCGVPGVVLVSRVAVAVVVRRRNPRPGYVDLTVRR